MPKTCPRNLAFTATVDFQAADGGDTPSFKLHAYTGAPMRLKEFFDPLVLHMPGIEFAKDKTAVIADHDPAKRIGHTTQQSVNEKGVFAAGTVSSSSGVAREFVADARKGFPFQCSLGARIIDAKFIDEGKSETVNGRSVEGPFILVTKCEIYEISVLTLGADSNTSATIAANQSPELELIMSDKPNTPDVLKAEKERIDGINSVYAEWEPRFVEINRLNQKNGYVKKVEINGKEMDITAAKKQAIANKLSPAEFELECFHGMIRDSDDVPCPIHAVPDRGVTRETLAAGIMCSMGRESQAEKVYGEHVMERSKPLQNLSLRQYMEIGLEQDGMPIPRGTHELIQATAYSTGTFPEGIADALRSTIREIYNELNQSWRSFCAIRPVNDFREHRIIQPHLGGNMRELGNQGQIKHTTFEGNTLTHGGPITVAEMLTIDRQSDINDTVGMLDNIAVIFARKFYRALADKVYSTLMGASSHYTSGNGNLLEAGSSLDVPSINNAIVAMRTQRDADNNDLDIVPRVLLVSPELQNTAQGVLESEFLERAVDSADQVPTGNPLRRTVKLEVESRLSNTAKFANASATQWFLFAGPIDLPMIVSFLDGRQEPYVDFLGLNQGSPSHLGVTWRIYGDFAADLGDPKASVKATGAA